MIPRLLLSVPQGFQETRERGRKIIGNKGTKEKEKGKERNLGGEQRDMEPPGRPSLVRILYH